MSPVYLQVCDCQSTNYVKLFMMYSISLAYASEANMGFLPNATGYTQYPGYCGCDATGVHPEPPKCGPATEVRVSDNINSSSKVAYATAYCDGHTGCTGFAIDSEFDVLLFFNDTNFSRARQPNPSWSLFWQGPPQPVPPPPSPPPPPPPFPSPDTCETDEECVLYTPVLFFEDDSA